MFKRNRTVSDPIKLGIREWVIGFLYAFCVVAALSITAFGVWIAACLFDNKPPIDVLAYKAEDALIGGTVKVHTELYRKRACALKTSRYVTDVNGKIVFIQEASRMVNGALNRVVLDEEYPIDPKAAPGTAVMHLFCSWECPNNIVHKYLPITREYTDTFELSLAPGQPDLSNQNTAMEDRERAEALANMKAKEKMRQ
jgi:hypothetical protein